MTRLDALKALVEKVEAGTVTQSDFWPSRLGVCELAGRRSPGWRAFNGSLDAAKALHEAVLPDVPWCIHDMSQEYLGARGWIVKVNWPHVVWRPTFTASGPFSHEATANNPARAWLLAILRALIAQEAAE